ncbi:MAG: hypothetical protein WC436_04660 [Candidatus Babeliales bacterium]
MLNKFFNAKNLRRSKKDRLLIFYILFFVFLVSCSKDNNKFDKKKDDYNLALLHETKNSDIPVPVNYFLNQKKINNSLTCYTGKLPLESVIDFYRINLEANGWQITNYSLSQSQEKEGYQEGLFFCEKTNKSCIISVRPDRHNRNSIYIFLKNKIQKQGIDNNLDNNIDIINSKQL